MENNDTDKLTCSILVNSKLEIKNPDFTLNLMGKIKAENQRKTRIRQSAFYLLLFVSIDTAIWTLLKLGGIRMSDLSLFAKNMNLGIEKTSSVFGNLFLPYLLIQITFFLLMIWRNKSGSIFQNHRNQ